MFEAPDIPGAADVIAWFDYWPTFHDAEVLSITLDREGGSRVAIHAFETTRDVDIRGRFKTVKHAVITFYLDSFPLDRRGITNTRIECFNSQNVLSNARVNKTPEGFELVLDGCYGVDASVVCERMSVKVEPGVPDRSIYRSI
jgi:Immunity protein 50